MAFVDTERRPAGEVQQKVGKLKLSEAVRECGYGYSGSYRDCVLGRAYARLTGRDLLDDAGNPGDDRKHPWLSHAAETFGISFEVAAEAEHRCFQFESSTAIADWLQSQGL